MSRDEIVSQLMDKVNSGKVTITLGEVTVKPSLRMQSMDSTCSPTMICSCSPSQSDGVAAGVVAGLSIALFFVGILIGIGLSLLLQWLVKGKIGKYNVSTYNKQRDEVIN